MPYAINDAHDDTNSKYLNPSCGNTMKYNNQGVVTPIMVTSKRLSVETQRKATIGMPDFPKRKLSKADAPARYAIAENYNFAYEKV